MSIIPPTISGEKKTAVVAMTASLIGIALIVTLLATGLIGEAAFSALFTVISLVCLFIAFSNRVESISLKELTINLSKVQEIQQAVIVKEAEPQPQGFGFKVEAYGTDDQAKLVIKSIGGTKYTFRNIDGIIADSNLPKDIAKDKLNWLILNELADEFEISGEKLYALSLKGHSVFSSITDQT